ncbi:alpha/beta hydrolase [Streptomyces sp. NPDC088354]|uniref:alpha/beta hydrolase n=1 Tax=Streptomyces sp. NPDC088354 TaxID=3365856 RepID=UPI0037F539E1
MTPRRGGAAGGRASRVRRAVILGVSVVLAAGALTASPASAYLPGPVDDPLRTAGVALAADAAADTGIAFGACPKDSGLAAPVQCGKVKVPVDYADPGGRRIDLLVSRLRATGPASGRQGALVFNPGGPGAPGLWFPAVGLKSAGPVTRKVWGTAARTYDLIGFDARGVGHSAPISCVRPENYIHAPSPDPRTANAAAQTRERAKARGIADGCGRRSASMLGHMTSADMARDLDVIRAALHETRLNYYGVSYGTYLGAVYATLFPRHVRRMVLDSVVNPDPQGVWYGANLSQDVAFEGRWADWRAWAARYDSVYGLGSTASRVQASFDLAMRKLAEKPAGGTVGPGELHAAAENAAYYDQRWVTFAHQLSRYLHGDDKPLVAAEAPDRSGAKAAENGDAVYLAVQCTDAAWPRDWGTWDRDNSRLALRHPFETWPNAWMNLPCATWPARAGEPVDVGAWSAELPPVLLTQSERDAATPYEGALELHRRLQGSRLVTEVGRGSHGLVSIWNACLVSRVDRYLTSGDVGDADARCAGHPVPVPSGTLGAKDANTGRYY